MNFPLAFPLNMTFKLFALAPQISVRDANGAEVMYVHQKLFKLKEEITVFSDESRSRRLYGIKADRIIDWSANYHFTGETGQSLGSIKRHGTRSLWKADYDVMLNDQPEFNVREQSAFVRFMDGMFSETPFLGAFSGYVFNPVYLVRRSSPSGEPGELVMRMSKQPSFLSRSFRIEKVVTGLNAQQEERLVLGLFMLTLLERIRG